MFTRNRDDRDDRRQNPGFLRGRSNRAEYSLYIGIAVVMTAVLNAVSHSTTYAGLGLLSIAMMRRLHDIGLRGWWTILMLCAPPVAAVLASSTNTPGAATLAAGVAVLINIIGVIVIGVVPGNAQPNRFGAPPANLWRRNASRNLP